MPTTSACLLPSRLNTAKFAFATRRVQRSELRGLIAGDISPGPGDLVLARVDEIGQHPRVELIDGRKAALFCGDEVVVCYGDRYAPDQFEAEVPADLGPCDLVAAGGLAARAVSMHEDMEPPTRLTPLGLLVDEHGERVNVARWALPPLPGVRAPAPTLVVVGTSMNSGKTTVGAYLARGLAAAGCRVGTAKVTGTGAGNDLWIMRDAGADPVLDFTDAGMASTYRVPVARLERAFTTLTGHLTAAGVDVIVIEIADGLGQVETAGLLASRQVGAATDAVFFAAGDALGASAGVEWLRRRGLPVVAVGGTLTMSPLATREAAGLTGLPVLGCEQLANPAVLAEINLPAVGLGAHLAEARAGQVVPA